jgi:MFS family permease
MLPDTIVSLDQDGWLLLVARALRSFGSSFISIVLVVYFEALHLTPSAMGAVFTTVAPDERTAAAGLISIMTDATAAGALSLAGVIVQYIAPGIKLPNT